MQLYRTATNTTMCYTIVNPPSGCTSRIYDIRKELPIVPEEPSLPQKQGGKEKQRSMFFKDTKPAKSISGHPLSTPLSTKAFEQDSKPEEPQLETTSEASTDLYLFVGTAPAPRRAVLTLEASRPISFAAALASNTSSEFDEDSDDSDSETSSSSSAPPDNEIKEDAKPFLSLSPNAKSFLPHLLSTITECTEPASRPVSDIFCVPPKPQSPKHPYLIKPPPSPPPLFVRDLVDENEYLRRRNAELKDTISGLKNTIDELWEMDDRLKTLDDRIYRLEEDFEKVMAMTLSDSDCLEELDHLCEYAKTLKWESAKIKASLPTQ